MKKYILILLILSFISCKKDYIKEYEKSETEICDERNDVFSDSFETEINNGTLFEITKTECFQGWAYKFKNNDAYTDSCILELIRIKEVAYSVFERDTLLSKKISNYIEYCFSEFPEKPDTVYLFYLNIEDYAVVNYHICNYTYSKSFLLENIIYNK